MRWLVEVTSLGKIDSESLRVVADSWHGALHRARAERGEVSSMGSFSIEVLDDGCRAVDAASLSRYEVRPIADREESVTQAPPPSAALGPIVSSLVPPRPSAHPAKRPSAVPQPSAAPQAAPATQETVPEASPPPASGRPASVPPPSSRVPNSTTIPAQIIFKREQERTQALPLTYREYVYVVSLGTSEDDAQTLLQAQLELVQSSLDGMAAGKLVNLAVFDAQFQGKPQGTPLATLTWKDWRGAPVISMPRRSMLAGVPNATSQMNGEPQPAATYAPTPSDYAELARATEPVAMAAQEAPPASQPVLLTRPIDAEPLPLVRPIEAAAFPAVDGPRAPPPQEAPFSLPAPIVVGHEPVARALANEPPPSVVIDDAPPNVVIREPPPSVVIAAPLPSVVINQPPPSIVVNPPPSVVINDAPSLTQASPPSVRMRGDDLITDLFEVMHDLHFLRDAVEGGDFCLAVAMERIPSLAGIVHLYDIDRREFVITSARGPNTASLLLKRHSEAEPLLAGAMRRRRAVAIGDATQQTASVERYAAVGGARSVIVAPVMQAGRYLGAIELLNPLDGQPFATADGDAVGYIAEQFAEFVATRGVVTDPERINARRPRA